MDKRKTIHSSEYFQIIITYMYSMYNIVCVCLCVCVCVCVCVWERDPGPQNQSYICKINSYYYLFIFSVLKGQPAAYVTLGHKTSHKGPFEIEMYASSESWINNLYIDVWFVMIEQYL